ncbi:non-specific serine/threonine protein kinase [Maritalea myrionectae]|uniref:Non-specific serine/threonine protein kinase n=1 Tax=Maritalea myrionectae TaxID=454601 RepID=A0A2R4MI69_9HYPH|nr:HEAT repeat domain-containing protein [Maritalea myrionectae]AVX05727.1 non-specific serine/threonine protein kinase [Maritalea myrionectae]
MSIWVLSGILALAAISILLLLVLRRIFLPRWGQKFKDRRHEIEQYLVLAVSSPVDLSGTTKPDISPREFPLALAAALDLVRSVTGQDAKRVAQIVDHWLGRDTLQRIVRESGRGQIIQVLTLLSNLDDPESKRTLYAHLAHADPYVQLAALRGLAQRADDEELPEIFEHIPKMDRTNAAFMADVLTQFGPQSTPFLVALLPQQTEESWCAAIIMALGNVGDMTTAPHIVDYAQSPSVQVRRAVARALGELQATDVIDTLHLLAQDEHVDVRKDAIVALGSVYTDQTYAVLLEALDDTDWWVTYHAAQALLKIGSKGEALLLAYTNAQGPHAALTQQIMLEHGGTQYA